MHRILLAVVCLVAPHVEPNAECPCFLLVQLSDAVSVIGREDFPAKWPNLLRLLVDKFGCEATKLPEGAPAPPAEQSLVAGYSVSFRSEPQLPVLCGVLHTAYSLFQHYTDESRTNELLAEIVLVVGQFAAPFTALLEVRARARAVACYGGVRLRWALAHASSAVALAVADGAAHGERAERPRFAQRVPGALAHTEDLLLPRLPGDY